MTDIVVRLEYVANFNEECGSAETVDTCHEAVAEIMRLREALHKMVYLQEGNPCTGIQASQWLYEAQDTLSKEEGVK